MESNIPFYFEAIILKFPLGHAHKAKTIHVPSALCFFLVTWSANEEVVTALIKRVALGTGMHNARFLFQFFGEWAGSFFSLSFSYF